MTNPLVEGPFRHVIDYSAGRDLSEVLGKLRPISNVSNGTFWSNYSGGGDPCVGVGDGYYENLLTVDTLLTSGTGVLSYQYATRYRLILLIPIAFSDIEHVELKASVNGVPLTYSKIYYTPIWVGPNAGKVSVQIFVDPRDYVDTPIFVGAQVEWELYRKFKKIREYFYDVAIDCSSGVIRSAGFSSICEAQRATELSINLADSYLCGSANYLVSVDNDCGPNVAASVTHNLIKQFDYTQLENAILLDTVIPKGNDNQFYIATFVGEHSPYTNECIPSVRYDLSDYNGHLTHGQMKPSSHVTTAYNTPPQLTNLIYVAGYIELAFILTARAEELFDVLVAPQYYTLIPKDVGVGVLSIVEKRVSLVAGVLTYEIDTVIMDGLEVINEETVVVGSIDYNNVFKVETEAGDMTADLSPIALVEYPVTSGYIGAVSFALTNIVQT